MKKLLFILLLSVFAYGQNYHVWEYKDDSGRLWDNWKGDDYTDSLVYYFDKSGADSIYSKAFRFTNWYGLFVSHLYVERISGTINLTIKIQVFDKDKWLTPHFPIDWRTFTVDSTSTSTNIGTVIGNANDSTDVFWTSAPLLNDSNYGWADHGYDAYRFLIVWNSGSQKGYIRQTLKPMKQRN